MRKALERIGRDVRSRLNIEAYVAASLALIFAVLSLVGDIVPEDARWAVLLGGVGILVYRVTVPDNNGIAGLLRDRGSFESKPFAKRLDEASEVWVFAPSAVNILAQDHCEALRSKILSRSNGIVRVVVLDPAREDSLRLAVRQLDESVEYPSQTLTRALGETLGRLALMASWEVPGGFAYRLLDYNPGFSIVAIDPGRRHGVVIVEFHGFHNTSTTSRMHIELAKADSDRWHEYWLEQFDRIWRDAKEPASNGSPSSSDRARGRLNAATEAAG